MGKKWRLIEEILLLLADVEFYYSYYNKRQLIVLSRSSFRKVKTKFRLSFVCFYTRAHVMGFHVQVRSCYNMVENTSALIPRCGVN